MLSLFFMMSLIICILMIMTIIINLISKKTFTDREKSSPFECGFDPKTLARLPFSLQFFLIALIFLIFDVEITLLLPMMIIMKKTSIISFTIMLITFIMILLGGLFHEWNQNALTWAA